MSRVRYELGYRLRRRPQPLALIGSRAGKAVALGLAVTTIVGYGVYASGVTLPFAAPAILTHRQERFRHYGAAHNYDSAHRRSGWLQVKTAVSVLQAGGSAAPGTAPDDRAATPVQADQATDTVHQATDPANSTDTAGQSDTTASQTDDPVTQATDTTVSASGAQPTAVAIMPSAVAPTVTITQAAPPRTVTIAPMATLPTISVSTPVPEATADLTDPVKKDIAMQLVSSAENSSLDWKSQYAYLEDIDDGRGYTGGIIGFTSGTGDMLELVQYYTKLKPGNVLAGYIPALQKDNDSDSHAGLGGAFELAWKTAAADPVFQQAQNEERDRVYFNPAVTQAKADGLRALGQFIYYDAIVMHGPGDDPSSFGGIRATAMKHAKTPAQGGDETTYLNAFLDARVAAMKTEAAHDDVSRVETEQRAFLKAGNFDLTTPLSWKTYGDPYVIQ